MVRLDRSIVTAILFILLLFVFKASYSQYIIEGTITDTQGKLIRYTQVLVKENTEKPAFAYTQANAKGFYKLSIEQAGKFVIVFNALSHKVKYETVVIPESAPKNKIVINVSLEPESIKINEILVEDKSPITVKEDTVIYNVDAFKKGDEEVAEDVLKRLPGIEVQDDGKIKFQGKPVSKVMVDGDDMFDKGYQLLTKGLNAEAIDKVEALTNQTENRKLKGVDRGDETVLNLVLKNDARSELFGNASAYGTDTKLHDVAAKLMLFSKKFKFYAIGTSNNMGADPLGNIREFYNTYSFQKKEGDPLEGRYIEQLDLKGYRPQIDEGFTTFNNSKLGSVNTIFKPTDVLKVKLTSFILDDEQEYFHNSRTEFYLTDTSFANSEDYNLNNRLRSAYGNVKLDWDINSRSNLVYEGNLNVSQKHAEAFFQFNDSSATEWIDNDKIEMHHELKYTNRFKENQAIVFNSKFNHLSAPEYYETSLYNFGELFGGVSTNSGLKQDFNQEMYDLLTSLQYLAHPNENIWLKTNVGFKRVNSFINSYFGINDSLIDYTNDLQLFNQRRFNYSLAYSNASLKYKLDQFEANLKVQYNFLDFKLEDSISSFNEHSGNHYLSPAIGLKWKFNEINKLNILYVFNKSPLNSIQQLDGYYMSGYNYLQKKNSIFGFNKNHNVMLLYNLGKFSRGRVLNFSLIYNYTEKGITSETVVEPEYSFGSTRFYHGREMILGSVYLQWFLDGIYNGLKIRMNTSKTSSPYFLNKEKYGSELLMYRPSVELRSAFLKWFNYETGITYSHTEYIGKDIQPVREQNAYLDLSFNFNKKLYIKFVGEHYYFYNYNRENRNYYFLNITSRYHLIPNKLKITFQLFNLFNEKKFGNESISEYSSSSSYYRLRGRYFMLGAFFRF